jgi:hypothetical protein
VSSGRYDWGADNTDVVLRAYGSVGVHENGYGHIVIRQERDDPMGEDDRWVAVPVKDAEQVAQAIIDKVREIEAGLAGDEQPRGSSRTRPIWSSPSPTMP